VVTIVPRDGTVAAAQAAAAEELTEHHQLLVKQTLVVAAVEIDIKATTLKLVDQEL
jgi:hypothetical protein